MTGQQVRATQISGMYSSRTWILSLSNPESCCETNMEETVAVTALPCSMEFKEICTAWGELVQAQLYMNLMNF